MCEKLKKTKSELLTVMGTKELNQWIAYTSLKDDKYKERLERDISYEQGKQKTQEQLAEDMRKMLLGIKNG